MKEEKLVQTVRATVLMVRTLTFLTAVSTAGIGIYIRSLHITRFDMFCLLMADAALGLLYAMGTIVLASGLYSVLLQIGSMKKEFENDFFAK